MDPKAYRKNILEYLKEFNKNIPRKSSMFSRKLNVNSSKLDGIRDKISLFFERGLLISPMSIDKNSINVYMQNLELVKQFPSELKPETLTETKILEQIKGTKKTRRILVPSIVQNNSQIIDNYDKMIAYYLLMEGEDPVKRFSSIEMLMKQFGVTPDIGIAIMKYGDEITTKLEELATTKTKSPKEWGCFKKQVLHSFFTAEKIGNRKVNPEEHIKWEERLIRLGILERRNERRNSQKEDFKESIKYDVESTAADQEKVALETTVQRNAEQMYINTGMVPLGYKKDENGAIVKIRPVIVVDDVENRLSASKNNLSATRKKQTQSQRVER